MGKSVPLPIALKVNNTIYYKTEEILPIFKEHWTNIFKPHESSIILYEEDGTNKILIIGKHRIWTLKWIE